MKKTITGKSNAENRNSLHFPSPRWYEILLLILLFSGPPSFRNRDPTASLRAEIDLSAGVEVAIWLLGSIWVFWNFIKAGGKIPRLGFPQILGGFLSGLFIISSFYSPAPILTLFRSFQVFVGISFTLYFVKNFGYDKATYLLFIGYLILFLGIYGSYFLNPDLVVRGDQYGQRIRGDWIAPASPVALSLIVILMINPFHIKFAIKYLIEILAIVLLILTRRRTGYLAMAAFGAVTFLTFNKKWSPIWKFLFVGSIIGLLIPFTIGWDIIEAWIIRNPNQIQDLSARIPLWSGLISQVLNESPLLGFGYYAASRVRSLALIPGLGNAHSSFVEVFVGTGALGATLYFGIWLWLAWDVFRTFLSWDRIEFTILGLLLIVLFFSTITSEGINVSIVSFTFWLGIAAWVQKRRQYSVRDPK